MSAFGEAPETRPLSADPVTACLDQIMDELVAVVSDCTPVADAARIDRIARLEQLRATTAALQVAESVRFAQSKSLSSSPPMCIRTESAAASPNKSD